MKRIAKFEKVTAARFLADWMEAFGGNEAEAQAIYDAIRLPRRATAGSAGYDFFAPAALSLAPGQEIRIPTGIRVRMEPGWGLGFKYRLQLNNTVGIIDSDYYASDNEGHIFAKLTNDSRQGKSIVLSAGEGFMQGIFLEYGLTEDDDAQGVRNGGFGSTSGR